MMTLVLAFLLLEHCPRGSRRARPGVDFLLVAGYPELGAADGAYDHGVVSNLLFLAVRK